MTDVVFQREMLPLGEFLKINLDIRVEQVVFDLRLDAANKLVADYKAKVNELQKQIIGLETNNEFH